MNNRVAIRLTILLVFGCVGLAPANPCQAGIALATPAGLSAGEQFQFVFLTDSLTTATSTDIDTYNTFVNKAAGGATYGGQTVTWYAIASTSTVSAITNTDEYRFPVYLTNGTKVATSTEQTEGGLYSGTLLARIGIDIDGRPPGRDLGRVWTGTNQDGSIATGNALGDDEPVYGTALPRSAVQFYRATQANDRSEPMYAISELLTAVPEPSTFLSMAIGMTIVLAQVGLRRRKSL